jgi:hypothetical protein
MNIDDAISNPALLGAALGEPATWKTWRVVLNAAFGIELNRDEARTLRKRRRLPITTNSTRQRVVGRSQRRKKQK